MNKTQRSLLRLFLGAIVVAVGTMKSAGQTWTGTQLIFNHPTLGDNGDYTAIYRADEINDRTKLRIRLGDEYTSDLEIGYHYYGDGVWRTTFSLDGWGNTNIRGGLTALGNYNPINFTSSWSASPDGTSNVSEISNDAGIYKQLMIVGNRSQGGDRRVGIWDRLSINGAGFSQNLNVSGSVFMSGNVGVGTNTLTEKLNVNGKILAEEVKVVVDVPADYVFNSNYQLMPLSVVSKFIAEQKHLPGIPSAADLKQTGWQLGEMSNKLLEKIEELTLYIIQQNEDIDLLRKQNARMAKEIETLKTTVLSKN